MRSAGRSWLLLTGCILFYFIYLLFGALVFSSIERPVEEKLMRDLEALKQELLNQSCVSAASLDLLLAKVLKANKYGVSVIRNTSSPSNWDLVSSMFFANTLVTTIGELEPQNGEEEGGREGCFRESWHLWRLGAARKSPQVSRTLKETELGAKETQQG